MPSVQTIRSSATQIEAAVQQLVDNGTYQKIAEKYPDIVSNLIYLNK